MAWLSDFELSSLLYIGIFLGVLVTFEGLRQILSRSESLREASTRRMRMVRAGVTTEDRIRLLKPANGGWLLSRLPFVGPLPADLAHAALPLSPGLVLAGMAGGAAVLTLALSVVAPLLLSVGLSLVVMAILPAIAIRVMARRRLDALVRQLPDALDLMSRGLSVGHPLNTTVAAVAAEMRDPIATEFGIIADQVSYGDDMVGAFAAFAERTGLEDARYLAVAVGIQHGTGGNLGTVLRTLAQVIRERIMMRRRIQAISAEGRLTSKFLSAIPLIIVGATSITAPDYYAGVSGDPLFKPFAAIIAGLVVANYLVLRRLVDFRI